MNIKLEDWKHPSDSDIIDIATEIVDINNVNRTMCQCPNFENALQDCLILPEYSYFGSTCEPEFYVRNDQNDNIPICFYLPRDQEQSTTRILKFSDVYLDPMSGVIFDRNKHVILDRFQMGSLWSDVQTNIKGVIHIKKAASFVQVIKQNKFYCVIIFLQIWADNYYHFINECLTRIVYFQKKIKDPEILLLVHHHNKFINEVKNFHCDNLTN